MFLHGREKAWVGVRRDVAPRETARRKIAHSTTKKKTKVGRRRGLLECTDDGRLHVLWMWKPYARAATRVTDEALPDNPNAAASSS